MAYIKQIPEKEKNLFARSDQTTPTPLPTPTGGEAISGAQAGSGVAPGMASSTQFGSNAAKLSDYLKANEPQVAEFGNQVAGKLTEGYNSALGAIDQGFGNFNEQVNKGYAQDNGDLINQATTNPTEFVKNPENVNAFKSLYNNSYSGPDNFEGTDIYANVNNQVTKAVDDANLVDNFGGLQTYLDNNIGGPGMTQGMKTLNTALLQKSPEASEKIRSAAQPTKGLTDYLGQKKTAANEAALNAKSEADRISQQVKGAFTGEGGVIPTAQQNLQNKFSSAKQKESEDAALQRKVLDFGSRLPTGNIGYQVTDSNLPDAELSLEQSEELARDLGLTIDELGELFNLKQIAAQGFGSEVPGINVNLSDYFTETPSDVMSLQNATSQEDYDLFQALSQLSGDNSIALPGTPQPGFNSSAFDKEGAFNRLNQLKAAIIAAEEKKRVARGEIVAPTIPGTILQPAGDGTMGAFF